MNTTKNNRHKLLVIMAHPDDESFGPGGTIAKYAQQGVEIQLLCATRGEAGKIHPDYQHDFDHFDGDLGAWRTQELRQAADILGIKKLEFLNFVDGTLSQNLISDLTLEIVKKIVEFKPQVIITFEPLGISHHLDHIAVSHATSFAFYAAGSKKYLKEKNIEALPHQTLKLFHIAVPQTYVETLGLQFREGYPDEKITTIIDVKDFFATKIKALQCHKSQKKDWERFLKRQEKVDLKVEFYHRAESFIADYDGHETDLFEGIDDPQRLKKAKMKEVDNLTLK